MYIFGLEQIGSDGYLTLVVQTLSKPNQKLNLRPSLLTLHFIVFPFIYIHNIVLGFTRRYEKRYLETDALPCLSCDCNWTRSPSWTPDWT